MSMSEETLERQTETAGDPISGDVAALAVRLRALAESDGGHALDDRALEQVMSAAIALYAQKAERCGEIFPLAQSGGTNATAVLMATTALLKGSSIELFELGMWQTWSGMK